MLSRRNFIAAAAVLAAAMPLILRRHKEEPAKTNPEKPSRFAALSAHVALLEKQNGGRIGFSLIDTLTGEQQSHRATEHFPMCSTFKFLLCAAVLHAADAGQLSMGKLVSIPAKLTLDNSPLTELHAGEQMTLTELCEAAMVRSDNTAANLLLDTLGGPAAVTAYARSIGDNETRLDRNEPSLNSSIDGDPRDTTTPASMAQNLNSIVLKNALQPASRSQMILWMEDCVTGLERLRKDMPEGWTAADKTGSNGEHTSNDIAIIWPYGRTTGRAPVIVSVYITQCPGPESKRNDIFTDIARNIRQAIQHS